MGALLRAQLAAPLDGHLGPALEGEPIASIGHLHAHVAQTDAAHGDERVVVCPLDGDWRRLARPAWHQMQRRISASDPPAPRRLLVREAQRLGERVSRVALGGEIAPRAVPIAAPPLEHERGPLAGREHGAELDGPHAQPRVHGARGEQLETHDEPARPTARSTASSVTGTRCRRSPAASRGAPPARRAPRAGTSPGRAPARAPTAAACGVTCASKT